MGDVWKELKALHRQPMYLANNWGFVPVQGALGVFTFWGPKARLWICHAEADMSWWI
jgi:hypothetical protein